MVDMVLPGIDFISIDGLKPVIVGGFMAAPPGFSFNYLFRYVIKFSFDFRLSWASSNFVFKVAVIVFKSVSSTLLNSNYLSDSTDDKFIWSIFDYLS
jgi:hypothetical protein